MEKLYAGFDGNRYTMNECINPSSHVDAVVLVAGVAQVYALPTGAKVAIFSATADFYMNVDGAAAIPVANVTDGSASILNPAARRVNNATTLGLISPVACVVTLELYA